ncbi:hypothetical protein AGMMS50276_20170 [Synergistales bacterium]|nr:hypothetical protein AGMMS50276_20170 [Synergistales bacterium]
MKRLFIAMLIAVLAFGVCGGAFAAATRDIIPDLSDANRRIIESKVGGATVTRVTVTDVTDPVILSEILSLAEYGETFTVARVTVTLTGRATSFTYNFDDGEGVFNYRTVEFNFYNLLRSADDKASVSEEDEDKASDSAVLARRIAITDGGDYDEDATINGVVVFNVAKLNGSSDYRRRSSGGCSVLTLGALLAFAIPLVAVSAKRKVKK